MGKALGLHLQGNVIGYLALFIAMSGVAYAASLPANSVGTKQLKTGFDNPTSGSAAVSAISLAG